MLLGARFHKVLDEGLQAEDDILEALDLLNVMNELVHRTLALGQFHLAVLRPEVVAAHHGIHVLHLLLLALEELSRQRVEGIVGQTGITDDNEGLHETHPLEFGEHIIDGQHPLTIGQLAELLHDLHVLHEVDIAVLGDGHLTALHLPTGVSEDIEVATEAEVLLVVGQEMQVEALVVVDIERVLDIKPVEGNGPRPYRRGKGILQHTDLVVVDIDIRKDILHHGIQDIAGLHQVVDARRVHALDDGLLVVRLLAVYLL